MRPLRPRVSPELRQPIYALALGKARTRGLQEISAERKRVAIPNHFRAGSDREGPNTPALKIENLQRYRPVRRRPEIETETRTLAISLHAIFTAGVDAQNSRRHVGQRDGDGGAELGEIGVGH